MILAEHKDSVQTFGINQKKHFTITANAKAFDLLANVAYKNKIEAVVRELSTNAYDSIVMAGKSEPFIVHLPNKLEPWFSVKDNGLGLSEIEFEELYGTLFASNKLNDNKTTGCFGIGSKSPFAYLSDSKDSSFAVINRYNNEETHYLIYKDEDGIPTYSLVSRKEYNGENGLEVRLNVNSQDFSNFHHVAERVLSFFSVRPTVIGGVKEFKFLDYKYIYKNEKFGIPENQYNQSLAIMGNVAYPINSGNVEFSYDERNILQNGIHLFFELGEVDFVLSREELAYNKKTFAVIKEALKDVKKQTTKELNKQFESCNTLWEAILFCSKANNGVFSNFFDYRNAEWKNKKISNSINIDEINKDVPNEQDKIRITKLTITNKKYSKEKRYINNIYVNNNTKFAILDTNDAPFSRVEHYLRNNGKNSIYIILYNADKLIKLYDIPKDLTVNISSLPKPPAKKRVGTGNSQKSLLYSFNRDSLSSYASGRWKAEEVDLKAGGVYIVIDRFQPIIKGRHLNIYDFNGLVYDVASISGQKINIYGVKKCNYDKFLTKIKKLNVGKQWVLFSDEIKNILIRNKDVVELIKDNNNISNYIENANIYKLVEKNHEIKKLIFDIENRTKEIVKNKVKINNFKKINSYINLYKLTDMTSRLEKRSKNIKEKYGLIDYLNVYNVDENCQKVIKEYIELIDNKV